MMRILKALGLALMAAFALSALAASAASAQEPAKITTSNSEPVTLTGTETGAASANRLTSPGGKFIQCPGSTYTVHRVDVTPHEPVPDKATIATITPHYNQANDNCTGPLGVIATVDMNGCDYVITSGETTGTQPEGGSTYGAKFSIDCPENAAIEVTLWTSATQHTNQPSTHFCTLKIGDKSGANPVNQDLTGAHLTDTKTNDGHIEINGTVEGIHIEEIETPTHEGILCANGTTNSGSFDIDVTVEHRNAGEPTVSLSH